jgi:hypothetical protein
MVLKENMNDPIYRDLDEVNANLALIEKYAKSVYENATILNRKLANTSKRPYAYEAFLDVNSYEISGILDDIRDLEETLRLMEIDLERDEEIHLR